MHVNLSIPGISSFRSKLKIYAQNTNHGYIIDLKDPQIGDYDIN